ncbi:MAG: hypothetical protein JXK94_12635 [Deltaproteobacteria bacterium]|nr:hypothetical protein [Deltaproteobacteria bacterium]
MAILPIRSYPAPVLRENVALETRKDQTLIDLSRIWPNSGLLSPMWGKADA